MAALRRLSLVVASLLLAPCVSAQSVPGTPMRIVVLVDSSSAVAPMLIHFRAALNEFLDDLGGDPEVTLISSGGQLRVRVPTTTDREKLREGVNKFTADGGANELIDALIEADRRFLKSAPERRPVFVIVTTDAGETVGDQRVQDYNRFMRDFTLRGGRAHGIVVRGKNTGITSDVLNNLTDNTGGYYQTMVIPNGLPDRMRELMDLLAADQ